MLWREIATRRERQRWRDRPADACWRQIGRQPAAREFLLSSSQLAASRRVRGKSAARLPEDRGRSEKLPEKIGNAGLLRNRLGTRKGQDCSHPSSSSSAP